MILLIQEQKSQNLKIRMCKKALILSESFKVKIMMPVCQIHLELLSYGLWPLERF
jgi:hypothetical protein